MAGSRPVSEHPPRRESHVELALSLTGHDWRTLLGLQALRAESRLAEPRLGCASWGRLECLPPHWVPVTLSSGTVIRSLSVAASLSPSSARRASGHAGRLGRLRQKLPGALDEEGRTDRAIEGERLRRLLLGLGHATGIRQLFGR